MQALRFALVVPVLALGAGLAACGSVPRGGDATADLAIANVAVVDVETGRVDAGRTVVVDDGRIVRVTGAGARADAAVVVDGTGKYLVPGLWDAHVHLSFTRAEALPLFVAHGVTSVRDLGSRLDDTRALQRRVAAGELLGPTITTAGPILEGAAWMQAAYRIAPPEHPVWAAGPRVVVDSTNVARVVDSLRSLGVDVIKSRNVYGSDFLRLADAAERAGLPLASHNPNRVGMVAAARHGLDSFEHAESIWGDFDTMTVAARAAMFREVAGTGAMVAPTLMADVGLVNAPDSVVLAHLADTLGRLDPRNRVLPAHMRTAWREAIEARRKYGEHPPGTFAKITADVRAMHRAGIPMLAGTDVGGIPLVHPGSSLHEELELLVREGGLSPLAALQSATRNPARFFRRERELGAVAAGHRADLVLLDADPLADIRHTRRIAGVVLRGRWLDRRALDALAGP